MNIGTPAPGSEKNSTLCYTYSQPPTTFDELWDADQAMRKHWQPLIEAIDSNGCDRLERCHQEVSRILRENGLPTIFTVIPRGSTATGNWTSCL